MIKEGKKIAKVVLILTGIIFLAHLAIPHHHHHGEICIEAGHYDNCTSPHNGNHREHDHPHDPIDNLNHCCISEFIPVDSNGIYRVYLSDISTDRHFPVFIPGVLTGNVQEVTLLSQTKFLKEDISLFYISVVPLATGLRAPPTV